jgi:hypothetical protein
MVLHRPVEPAPFIRSWESAGMEIAPYQQPIGNLGLNSEVNVGMSAKTGEKY